MSASCVAVATKDADAKGVSGGGGVEIGRRHSHGPAPVTHRLDTEPRHVPAGQPQPAFDHRVAPEVVDATTAELDVGRGFILAVGTLEPRKNLPLLLRAYHRLRREVPGS